MKKLLSVLLILITALNTFAVSANNITASVNDVKTQISTTTMLPMRGVFKPLEAAVEESVTEKIAKTVSPAVFYIEVYNSDGNTYGTASGFFISASGVAVTNYHVFRDSASAIITTLDGERYNREEIIAFNEKLDIAIFKVNKTSLLGNTVESFPIVTMTDSDDIKTGQRVFAVGNPKGVKNIITEGTINNPKRIVGEKTLIEMTAPIAHGSSGGVLVDEYGRVLGITSYGVKGNNNIGYSIPINLIKSF